MVATIYAGPATWDRPFRIDCAIRVDANDHVATPAATAGAPSVGAGGAHVAVLAATPVPYESPEFAVDEMCTSVTYHDGTQPVTIYHTFSHNGPDRMPGTGDESTWSTDPASWCVHRTPWGGPSIDDVVDWALTTLTNVVDPAVRTVVDPAVCAATRDLHTTLGMHGGPQPGALVYVDHEGDVFVTWDGSAVSEANWRETLWWDCPGYVDFGTNPWDPAADGTPVVDP